MKEIQIENKIIGANQPTYFVADIAANHDGDLERAKDLIYLCAEAGADAAKFQHFTANTIVSDYGFKSLGGRQSHQEKWKKSVFDVYRDASLNQDWTPILKETCDKAGITFFTSPYSFDLVDKGDSFIGAYKIGSGDITWHEIIRALSLDDKPLLIATGASNMYEVELAMDVILENKKDVVLKPITSDAFPLPAPRGKSEALLNARLSAMNMDRSRPWQEALKEYIDEIK